MPPDTSGELGSILAVWAHPDDEAYSCAGLMARAVDAGRRVVCVTATKGEAGFPVDDPRSTDELAALRVSELDACLRILGVTDHRYLGYADGGCAEVDDQEAAAQIAAVIHEVRPDTILTFGPDGGTGHPDHIAACRWTSAAVDLAPDDLRPRLLYTTKTVAWVERVMGTAPDDGVYMVDDFRPEALQLDELAVHFTCTGELLDRKVAALRAQASQVEPMVAAVGEERYRDLVAEEFFRERRPGDRAVTLPNARR